MKIKIINKSQHPLPKHQTALSAGMDLYANVKEAITLKSLERKFGSGICQINGYVRDRQLHYFIGFMRQFELAG